MLRARQISVKERRNSAKRERSLEEVWESPSPLASLFPSHSPRGAHVHPADPRHARRNRRGAGKSSITTLRLLCLLFTITKYLGIFEQIITSYSCGLSTATIEYSSLSVCLSVCLCTR